MKKRMLIIIIPLLGVFMAFKTIEHYSKRQMKHIAETMVDNFIRFYMTDSCIGHTNTCYKIIQPDSLIVSKICLLNVLRNVADALYPVERQETGDNSEKYQKWVPWAVKNRHMFITVWDTSQAVLFWEMVDNAAINKKLNYKARKKLFLEIGKAVNYYDRSLQKLSSTTEENRKIIFDLVAKIGPREKAYQLQEDLHENKTTALTKANVQLRKKLREIGIGTLPPCKNRYHCKFTRYDRTYDYLFAISRWTKHNDGNFTHLITDGKKLASISYEAMHIYKIKD
jgi:hypothetical protein